MRVARRGGTLVGLAVLLILATPAGASASVSISVPSSVNLGSVPIGSASVSNQLGPVTVTSIGIAGLLLPSFTATVSTTTFTATVGGTTQTIPLSSISYWSGPVTTSMGLQSATPGQPTATDAQILSAPRTAFSASGLITTITTTWNPTLIVTIPANAVAGTYSATITQSVA